MKNNEPALEEVKIMKVIGKIILSIMVLSGIIVFYTFLIWSIVNFPGL